MKNLSENWDKPKKEIQSAPKFVARGTRVTVDTQTPPKTVTVKGKYGDRDMNVINTIEYGLVYVTPIQFCDICKRLQLSNYDKNGVVVSL